MKKERIIIKLSGKVFESQSGKHNIDFNSINKLAQSIIKLRSAGFEIGIVVGAGNILRGRDVSNTQADKIRADYMGMLGTIINSMALQTVLQKVGVSAKVLSAVSVPSLVEDYSANKAKKYISKNIVIFAGGIGRPNFTTDTTAVVRAIDIGAKKVFKATDVVGVFSADPQKNKQAVLYKNLSYTQAIKDSLKVMDQTAFVKARKAHLIIRVFKYSPQNIVTAVKNGKIGTQVSDLV